MISHIHGFRFLVHSSVTDAVLTQTAARFFGLPVTYADVTVVSGHGTWTTVDVVPMPGTVADARAIQWSAEDVDDGTLRIASGPVVVDRRGARRAPFVQSLLSAVAAMVTL